MIKMHGMAIVAAAVGMTRGAIFLALLLNERRMLLLKCLRMGQFRLMAAVATTTRVAIQALLAVGLCLYSVPLFKNA